MVLAKNAVARSLMLSIFAVGCCQLTMAQSGTGSVTERNQRVVEKLEELQSATYLDKPFGEVLIELRDQMECNVVLHPSALDNNLDVDTPVSISLDSVSRAQFLSLILETYECAYLIKDGVLIIASYDYAYENPMMEVLDASELLATIQPLTRTRGIRSWGGGSGKGGGVFQVADGYVSSPQQLGGGDNQLTTTPAASETGPTIQLETIVVAPAEQLLSLIEESVDPDSWEVNGGMCRLRELNGKLVILQTAKNLREIKILLDSLK